MPDFNIRTDAVDVEQIMRQIRARIREKRGVDYTEEQIQELASVKLEKFLDPQGVRSDLVEQFRRSHEAGPPPPNYGFEDSTMFESHRGLVRLIRRLLNPILKLFFNPNPISHVLHMQSRINDLNAQRFHVRDELDALYYEVIHNLVIETTRLGIEVKNLKMRVESISGRLDFDERRARTLEGIVQYRPGAWRTRSEAPEAEGAAEAGEETADAAAEGAGEPEGAAPRRRRRRRRGRRGRSGAAGTESEGPGTGGTPPEVPEARDATASGESAEAAAPAARDAAPEPRDTPPDAAGANDSDPVPSDQ